MIDDSGLLERMQRLERLQMIWKFPEIDDLVSATQVAEYWRDQRLPIVTGRPGHWKRRNAVDAIVHMLRGKHYAADRLLRCRVAALNRIQYERQAVHE